MKASLKATLIISVLLNICLVFLAMKRMSGHTSAIEPAKLFSITNLNGSASGGYIISFQNGKYWWTIDGDVLSMNAGIDQEVTLRLKDGRIKSTTVELYDANHEHCYFTDFNADGIPDKKRIGSDENWQIFYRGEFVPSFAQETNRYILQNGKRVFVKFVNDRWATVE